MDNRITENSNEMQGSTALAEFIRENLAELITRKTEISNRAESFVYFTPSGEFKEGRKSQYGQDMVEAFGGYASSKKQAIAQLQHIIDSEPFEQRNEKLREYLK